MNKVFNYPQCVYGTRPALGTVAKNRALSVKDGKILWHVDEKFLTSDLEKYKIILAFEKTFQTWQTHFAPIKLESTANIKEAPIVIRFMKNGNPDLPARFEEGTLAYCYFPNRDSLGIESDMYFNDAYQWAEMHKSKHINLFKVAVHEVGHAFGFDHSTDIKDIMYPTYQPNDDVLVTKDTDLAVDFLYGEIKKSLGPKTPVFRDDQEALLILLRGLFPVKALLRRLSEEQLVFLGESFGLGVHSAHNKNYNVQLVYDYLF